MKIDLIVPTYKPNSDFIELINMLEQQSLPINKIIIINTEQKYFERIMYTGKFLDRHNNIEVRHLSKTEFDCGKSRNKGVQLSDADYFLMMSQDAMPVGNDFLKTLMQPLLRDPKVVCSYARQIAKENSGIVEKTEKRYYFPEDAHIYSLSDVDTFGSDAYFVSNGACLYRRDLFDEVGGFINHAIINEDILFGAKALNAGYKIAYTPEASVIYSKDLTKEEQFKLYFDLGVSHSKHPEIYSQERIKEANKNLNRIIIDNLIKNGQRRNVLEYKRVVAARKKGYKKGRKYKNYPMSIILKYTANKEYWHMDEILRDRTAVNVHSGYGRSEAEIEMIKNVPGGRKMKTDED